MVSCCVYGHECFDTIKGGELYDQMSVHELMLEDGSMLVLTVAFYHYVVSRHELLCERASMDCEFMCFEHNYVRLCSRL